MGSFGQMLLEINPDSASVIGFSRFREAIARWIEESGAKVVLEVGGGRSPLFSAAEAEALGVERYLVNDVSSSELDRLPPDRERACFDIQVGPPDDADYVGKVDFAFAHSVFEHIGDPAAAWSVLCRLLRPGGIAVSFHPVLYSPPFVVNRLLPERLGQAILQRAFPRRHDDDHPKFPAYYRWCRASPSYVRQRLEGAGFSHVDVRPLYGHEYFDRIPVLRSIDHRMSDLARERSWPSLASYAYVIATR